MKMVCTSKKILGHSKLKLQTFFWGQGECEWSLETVVFNVEGLQYYH